MSDAWEGFATGFAQGFNTTFTAGLKAKEEEKRDKIRFGAQAWLKKEERYNAAKQADKLLMDQAKALTSSESLIPNDAVVDVYNMLKSGRTAKMIIDDVRTAGSSFESLPTPSESSLNTPAPEDEQTTDILGQTPDATAESGSQVIGEAPKEDDPNNPFTQYRAEIQDAVGQTDNPYFDQVLSGYTPEVRTNKYKFTPGISKTDIVSLDSALAANLYESDAFKNADNAGQQKLILETIQAKKKDPKDDGLPFGTGGVGAAMTVWAMTDDGKAALANSDAMAIAKQYKEFDDLINPTESETSGAPKKDFDLEDLEGSFMNIWERSNEGKAAIESQDFDAIAEAVSAASEQAHTVRASLNKGYGFKPEDIKDLKDIPGAREKYKDYPVVLAQLATIEEGLLSQKSKENSLSDTPKPHSVYGMVDGNLAFIGTGNMRGGRLYLPDPDNPDQEKAVPVSDAAQMIISSTDNPIDVEKWAANDIVKKRNTLFGTVDFADTALTYVSTLQSNPLARTRVARITSGASELLEELKAIREIATVLNPDGEEVIDRAKLIQEIEGNAGLSNFSAGVRSVMAQETALIFDIARAEGNSGTALSNKDYENYFRSIFNSTNPKVIEENIVRKVGQSMKASMAGARSIAQSPGMQYAMSGTGGRWWDNPKETALANRTQPLVNFVNSALDAVDTIQESSSYRMSPQQKLTAYTNGEEITVDEDMVKAFPQLAPHLGKKLKAPEK